MSPPPLHSINTSFRSIVAVTCSCAVKLAVKLVIMSTFVRVAWNGPREALNPIPSLRVNRIGSVSKREEEN